MLNEIRVFGPPGTGKTTWLSRNIGLAAEKHNPEGIVVASYTKTAAAELNSRDLPIPDDNIGTLHALCYRAMGKPKIAEAKEQVGEWNEKHPEFAMTGEIISAESERNYRTDGDKFLAVYNLHRARLLHPDRLPHTCHAFRMAWEKHKFKTGYVDFTDMISYAIVQERKLDAKILFLDEAQDFNPLQFQLLRMWEQDMEYVIIAGDDDQTLFQWCGASPEAFLNPPVPEEQKRILSQSWRLPRAVQSYASKWISQIKHREPKNYLPRDFEGKVSRLQATIADPEPAVDQACRYVEAGKSVMFLTTCIYMTADICKTLKDYGLAYHNSYRPSEARWNPLGSFSGKRDTGGRVSTRERLVAFLDRSKGDFWDPANLSLWSDIIKHRGIFKKGAKELIEDAKESFGGYCHTQDLEWYKTIFEPDGLQHALDRDVNWFKEALLASKIRPAEYSLEIYDQWGLKALTTKPLITVGTVHSVKGGEADIVFLWPDISHQAWENARINRDELIRTFYVGMTRAREELILCAPSNHLAMRIDDGTI